MDAVQPWFCKSLFKPAEPQPAGLPDLDNDSYEVKDTLQINKHETHSKVKWMGYDSSHNQCIQLSKL